MSDDVADRRVTYARGVLDDADVVADPFAQFDRWFGEAVASPETGEANAMCVSTIDADGTPSSRIVLLRAWDERGFVFYTNYDSRKGRALAANPRAAALFWWQPLERQIRIEGAVERASDAESDAYFARRPRGHRIAAWSSPQSEPVASRATLEAAIAATETRFDEDVPRPPFWGGYRIVPQRFEFWQGRPNRVHDRFAYVRAASGWQRERLAP